MKNMKKIHQELNTALIKINPLACFIVMLLFTYSLSASLIGTALVTLISLMVSMIVFEFMKLIGKY